MNTLDLTQIHLSGARVSSSKISRTSRVVGMMTHDASFDLSVIRQKHPRQFPFSIRIGRFSTQRR